MHLDIWSAAFHLQRNKIKGFSRVVRAFYVQFQILSCYLRGGFSLAGEEFGGRFDNSFPTCTFFFKVGISLHTPIPPFGPGLVRNGSAS